MKTADDVRAHILAFVGHAVRAGLKTVTDDFDLRRDGAIDSLGFLRLLTELETKAGRTLDLSAVDPAQLTNLRVLTHHIAGQIA
jgi:acyl carrier protein